MAAKGEAEIKIKVSDDNATSTIAGIGKSFTGMLGTIAAARIAFEGVGAAIGDFVAGGAEYKVVQENFRKLVDSQGAGADEMMKKIKSVSDGTVTELELMQAANKAMIEGLPIQRFDEMVAIAQNASDATGKSFEEMINTLSTGINKGSEMALNKLGIVVNAQEAYDDYAKSVGKTANVLTEMEKKFALTNKVLDQGTANLKKLGGEGASVAERWDALGVNITDVKNKLSAQAMPVFEVFIGILEDMGGVFTDLANSDDAGTFFRDVALFVVAAKDVVRQFIDTITNIPDVLGAYSSAIADAITFNFEGAKNTIAELENIINEKRIKSAEKTAKEVDSINEAFEKKTEQDLKASIDRRTAYQIDKSKISITEVATLKAKAAQDEAEALEKAEKEEIESIQRIFYEHQALIDEMADEKDRIAKKEEEDEKIRMEAQKARYVELGNFISAFTSKGLEGVFSTVVSTVVERYFPGLGKAAGDLFNLLAMETDKFNEQWSKMISASFIANIAKNFAAIIDSWDQVVTNLVDMLVENFPDIAKAFVEALIKSFPELQVAFFKIWTQLILNPDFWADFIKQLALGIKEGIGEVANDFRDMVRKAFEDAFKLISGGKTIDNVGGGAGDFFKGIGDYVEAVGRGLGLNQGGAVIKRYAMGGAVDNQLAALTVGEYVINRDSAQANMGLLDAINNSNGRQVAPGNSGITIVVNGGFLGDANSARDFALAVDEQLYKLRLGRESRAFDQGLF